MAIENMNISTKLRSDYHNAGKYPITKKKDKIKHTKKAHHLNSTIKEKPL